MTGDFVGWSCVQLSMPASAGTGAAALSEQTLHWVAP